VRSRAYLGQLRPRDHVETKHVELLKPLTIAELSVCLGFRSGLLPVLRLRGPAVLGSRACSLLRTPCAPKRKN
jgi:hypothetical protein